MRLAPQHAPIAGRRAPLPGAAWRSEVGRHDAPSGRRALDQDAGLLPRPSYTRDEVSRGEDVPDQHPLNAVADGARHPAHPHRPSARRRTAGVATAATSTFWDRATTQSYDVPLAVEADDGRE